MIELKNITKTITTSAHPVTILRNVSLSINEGEFVLITGKSGSGKSTLLNMLTGVDTPTSGEIIFHGEPIHSYNENQMAIWRGENLGIVFQFFQLIPTLSVEENILLPMDLAKRIPSHERAARAKELLTLVGLSQHAHKLPSALSGGEQQRIAIARALANNVNTIIADEPTGNLDSVNANAIFDLLEILNKKGKTIIMVTHEREVLKGATRKIEVKDGQIISDAFLKGGSHEATH